MHKRALARVFETILNDGIEAGEFPAQNLEASAACVVGVVLEALVSPLTPDSEGAGDDGFFYAVAQFCLRGTLQNGLTAAS